MSSLLWHAPAFRRAQLLRPAPAIVRTMASSAPPPMPVTRIHFPSLDSTNSYAKAHARELRADGVTVITTDQQTAGRGRLARTWISAAGGDDITMTFAFHVPPAALRTAYQLSPLLAVVARRAFAPHGVDVGIKWPNDIIVGGARKMGGILAEMEALPGGAAFLAVLGIGLNINSMPADLGVARPVWPLTTLRAETGGGATRHDVKALTDSMVNTFAAVSVVTARWRATTAGRHLAKVSAHARRWRRLATRGFHRPRHPPTRPPTHTRALLARPAAAAAACACRRCRCT
jgi:biotin-(acetyl-CoA carboxylase) ligase